MILTGLPPVPKRNWGKCQEELKTFRLCYNKGNENRTIEGNAKIPSNNVITAHKEHFSIMEKTMNGQTSKGTSVKENVESKEKQTERQNGQQKVYSVVKENQGETRRRKKRKKKIIINVRKKAQRREATPLEVIVSQSQTLSNNGEVIVSTEENLGSSRNGTVSTHGRKKNSKNKEKSDTKTLKKAFFFGKEYDISEVRNCQISDFLLKVNN
ncbi:conserved Plasmodium protein, unknown function [Plasmodium ovale curtisi]|uniref:Uncharacterized protein n=1 Tax=Plasmodium ovale curtisi TaxID=864141 RepID=A0A1A8VJT2_PLAOA|nr:conserved Plasmodium protein, unknown function [Plasmodium ovale curtisi]